jgi:hypothetical protein
VFIANSTRLLPRRWDPFRPWRELYNSWNIVAQWAMGIFGGAWIVLASSYIVLWLNPNAIVTSPIGETVVDKAHALALWGIAGSEATIVASLVVFVGALIIQRSGRTRNAGIAVPAE